MITLYQKVSTKGPIPGIPIISMGIAADDIDAAVVWRTLHHKEFLPYRTDPKCPPAAPWVADALYITATMAPDALLWTADLSRCLAWTWIEQLCDAPLETA
jgi:hypothetical protein